MVDHLGLSTETKCFERVPAPNWFLGSKFGFRFAEIEYLGQSEFRKFWNLPFHQKPSQTHAKKQFDALKQKSTSIWILFNLGCYSPSPNTKHPQETLIS